MTDFLSLAAPGVRQLKPYQPGKPIEELERELGVSNIIKLASNENPLGPSPLALTAARAALEDVWLYPDGNGFVLKDKLKQKLGVAMEQLILGNGSSDILDFAVRAFVTPQDEVMFSEHAFAVYPILTQAAGARAVVVPAKNWGHDLTAMRSAITERTRLIFIANPNNPTGTWLPAAELEAFIADLPAHVLVLVDEAYFEYASYPAMGAADYPDAIAWVGRYPNLIVARTFSKCYGLAGLRVGYGVCHPQVADLMNRVRPPFNVNSLALAAAAAALDDSEHLQQTLALNAAGMDQLTAGFASLDLRHIPSVGNFVSVDTGRTAAPLYDALLREGVIVRPVANYGMPNHLRVTIGLPEENARFLAALAKVLGR
ncbi:histidinol-phosphate transaminase [Sulfurivermis fontis]|uniref:histidinol-phosphate transaminase n=1 Tax=Sulfurivermis fontis TaxID=1972068 RepID=UPI0015597E65|nr:histidinol-phosphate transaminase [Sulfurivermis fontis]